MPMTLFILLNEKTCVTSLKQPHQSMQNFCLFCQKKKKTTLSILYTHFYKTPTLVYQFYTFIQ